MGPRSIAATMIHWEAFTLGLLLLPYPYPAAAVLTVAPSLAAPQDTSPSCCRSVALARWVLIHRLVQPGEPTGDAALSPAQRCHPIKGGWFKSSPRNHRRRGVSGSEGR